MKILIINTSPVRDGATAEIVNTVRACTESRNEVRAVCIDDYRIQLCRGCRACHTTAKCFQKDDVDALMAEYEWADSIITVSPSYWADVPGQFKVFIDRCTPWCNTHEPHAKLTPGKRGYSIALRTGPNMRECERIIGTIEHFYGHLEIQASGSLGLCGVECKKDAMARANEIRAFCAGITGCVTTPRMTIYPASDAEMRQLIDREQDAELKQAYSEMLAGCIEKPEQRLWYTAWFLTLPGGERIGDLCFKGLSPEGAAEIGYGLLPEYEGKGYATEAVRAMTEWALQQPGVCQIEAETEPDNTASQRVLEKAGFLPTGITGGEGPRFVRRK